ncbi:MAG TPA: response regulator [Casimicrobiaceae bacterium]|nr:response regulator [Casimicrobiaceae bacterium]
MTSATVLVVEDEPEIRRFLHASFNAEGYRVVESASGRRGMIDAGSHKPDLAIVDLGLPDIDGIDVIRRIREWSSMPVIVLSARTQERTKIDALDAGANDYITKPFGVGELLARVRAALRHRAASSTRGNALRLGEVIVDLDRRIARGRGEMLHLTPIEFRLLATLARHLGMVVTHRELLCEVWGPTHAKDTHYLRIYAKQLRDKIEADPVRPRYLITETGVGYRLLADE